MTATVRPEVDPRRGGWDELLDRLERRVHEVEAFDEPVRTAVFDLLDGIDAVHRAALSRLADLAGSGVVDHLRADPAVCWLLDAYGVGFDQRVAAAAALETVRPYVESHGGTLELLDVSDGVVEVRLAGSCSGCSGSAVTLSQGVEEALRDHLPGFLRLEVDEDGAAAPHAPPGPTLVELRPRR
ncbi:MAG: NifU family protein [Acidimicrobiales bacterium]